MVLCLFEAPASDASAKGPTASKLKSLGNDVAVPAEPPLGENTPKKLKGDPTGPIDGGADKPPYDLETDRRTLPEGSDIPVPAKRLDLLTPAPDKKQTSKPDDDKVTIEQPMRNVGCLAKLRTIAIAEPAASPEADDAGCVIPDPVILKSTKGKAPVNFSAGLLLDCTFALQLADFTSSVVQPLAQYQIGKSIDTVLSGEGFVCRRRNNALTGKLSEHAVGNATDWIGFEFRDGSRLGIRAADSLKTDEHSFLRAVRTSACGYFTTVLGPGSNAAHATHFHFDLGRTAPDKKNPYRICE